MAERRRRGIAGSGAGSGSKGKARPTASSTGGPNVPSGDAATEGEGGGGWAEWGRSLLLAVILFLVLRTFVLGTFVITSGSMEDTLLVGDFVVVNRVALGPRIPRTQARLPGYATPALGDILVFDPPHERDLRLVKRVVGMGGDVLEMRDGVLHRNGEATEEPYVLRRDPRGDEYHPWMEWQREHLGPGVDPVTYRPSRDNWGPLVIPPDHFFMLGDNRDQSLDSRYWGLIERWRLEGRASFLYFSYDRESPRPFRFIRDARWGRIFNGVE
jgi:signal peptidase I